MTIFVPIAMFGWIALVLALFATLPARRAVITSLIAGWLFLPMAAFKLQGLPTYDKSCATCAAVLLATLIFDFGSLTAVRPRWFDLPAVLWCICSLFSSLSNDLGLYDGLSCSFRQMVIWGLPYLIGRVYFSDIRGVRELAVGIFVGGLIYVPLCLWEVRMSPQLHRAIYGYYQHEFAQTIRYGGFRPMVFMQHGLAVGMWMTTASLVGIWLWLSRSVVKIRGIRIGWFLTGLVITTVLCKSSGALLLLLLGVAVLMLARRFGSRAALFCVLLAVPCYMCTRATGLWSGDTLSSIASDSLGPERAQSLTTRLTNEDMLARKALQRPIFGWAGWGRARVYNDYGKDITRTDGMWIIALGDNGVVGLAALTAFLLLPTIVLLWRWPVATWTQGPWAPAAGLVVMTALNSVDCIFNAMINPIYLAAIGGLLGLMAGGAVPATDAQQRAPNPRVRVRVQRMRPSHSPRTDTALAWHGTGT